LNGLDLNIGLRPGTKKEKQSLVNKGILETHCDDLSLLKRDLDQNLLKEYSESLQKYICVKFSQWLKAYTTFKVNRKKCLSAKLMSDKYFKMLEPLASVEELQDKFYDLFISKVCKSARSTLNL